jgi:hypothetical protein
LNKELQILNKLYPLALELQDLAPWQWMFETELFGVQLPDSDTPYFVSIMGSAGQFNAVSIYEGVHAAEQILWIQGYQEEVMPDDILLIPHLMVSFDNRQLLQPDESQRIKDLDYAMNERKQWPVFQQVIPGHPHMFPELSRLRDLIPVLEQTLNVVRRTRDEEFAFIERTQEGVSGLFRISEDGQWRDQYMEMLNTFKPVSIPASSRMAAQLNRMPKEKVVLEVDLALMPNPVMDRDPSYFPFILLLVEKESGYIVHFELLTPHPNVDEMFAGSGRKLLEALINQKIHPQEIQIRSKRLQPVLNKSFAGTSVQLKSQRNLPALEDALVSLRNFMG